MPSSSSSSTSSSSSSSSSSSLSSDPDYQVAATSDLNDDTGTVVLPRPADAEGYASFLHTQDEADAVCKKYNIPKDHYTVRPAGDLRASSSPPLGAVCVYVDALEAGMRVPLHPFFGEALAHFGIAPTQLATNAWRITAGFLVLCRSSGVPSSLAVFRRFFVLRPLNQKRKKEWYFFQSKSRDSSGLRFTGLPDSIKDWKRWFFFLSSPTPWPCPVEWREPSKSSFMEPVLSDEEKESAEKLLTAYGGAAVEIRTCLSDSNLAAAIGTDASPPPFCTRRSASSKAMDSSVYDKMKTMLAEKMVMQASPSVKKMKIEQGSSPLCRKKRNLDEANADEDRPACSDTLTATHGHSARTSVNSPLPGLSWNAHAGDKAHWEAARKLLEGAVAPPQQRVFAASKPSDVVTSSYAAILQATNYVSFSLSYALELEQKLMARDVEVAALRQQLEEAKGKLAAAKVAAEAEADPEHPPWKGGDSRRTAWRT